MTRRVVVVLAFFAVLCIPAFANADTVKLADYTNGDLATNAPGGGGPFLATTTGSLLGNSSFVTFCIEYIEHFSYGTTYNFTLSDGAIAGGVSGGNPDPVSDATKWLYYEAISGGYTAFAQFGTGSGVGARIQEAIWYLEGERLASQVNADSVTLANFAGTQNWAALYAQGHRVYAMNLTTLSGGLAQDQLAYASVPDPGSTLLLFGVGLAGLTAIRRGRG